MQKIRSISETSYANEIQLAILELNLGHTFTQKTFKLSCFDERLRFYKRGRNKK